MTYVVGNTCHLYNYADDNTLGFWHNDLDDLRFNFAYGSKIAIEWFQENHMKVNVSKFQSIILKPKGAISDVEFHVSAHSLKSVSSVKLLGVQIDERLSFDDHISTLCANASHQISALRRIVKYLTLENRMSIYNAFIASNFNHCSTVWHFCSNRSLYKLEKLHKQALRVVLNDYSSSYRELLDKVSKPTLYVSRLKAIAIEAYKCKANENPDYINVMLNPLIKPYNLRGGPRVEQPKVNTTSCGLHSSSIRLRNCGMKCLPTLKKRPLYIISNHFYRNGLGLNATVALVSYVSYTMYRYFSSYIIFIDLLGYTGDYITLYIITDLCFSQIDELYQSPYRRCHVSYFPNVCR